jgi:hypothetical protein
MVFGKKEAVMMRPRAKGVTNAPRTLCLNLTRMTM